MVEQHHKYQGTGDVDQTTGNARTERVCLAQTCQLNGWKCQQKRPDKGQQYRQPQGLNRQQKGILHLLLDAFSDIFQFSFSPPATDDQKQTEQQTDYPDGCLLTEGPAQVLV